MEIPAKAIIVIMGVSGCGKSTLGRTIAAALQVAFIEGDDYHPEANVAKMSQGIPLDDADRSDWLKALHEKAGEYIESGAVIACSALKETYRYQLSTGMEDQFLWILLDGTYDVIFARMQARTSHFMPPALLRSQFDTLEKPDYAFRIDVNLPAAEQSRMALEWIKKKAPESGAH